MQADLSPRVVLSPNYAGEALVVGDVVCLSSDRWVKADANGTTRPAVGVVTEPAAKGRKPEVCSVAEISGYTGLTTGAPVYLSETAGGVSQTAPGYRQEVGYAVDAGRVHFDVRPALDEEEAGDNLHNNVIEIRTAAEAQEKITAADALITAGATQAHVRIKPGVPAVILPPTSRKVDIEYEQSCKYAMHETYAYPMNNDCLLAIRVDDDLDDVVSAGEAGFTGSCKAYCQANGVPLTIAAPRDRIVDETGDYMSSAELMDCAMTAGFEICPHGWFHGNTGVDASGLDLWQEIVDPIDLFQSWSHTWYNVNNGTITYAKTNNLMPRGYVVPGTWTSWLFKNRDDWRGVAGKLIRDAYDYSSGSNPGASSELPGMPNRYGMFPTTLPATLEDTQKLLNKHWVAGGRLMLLVHTLPSWFKSLVDDIIARRNGTGSYAGRLVRLRPVTVGTLLTVQDTGGANGVAYRLDMNLITDAKWATGFPAVCGGMVQVEGSPEGSETVTFSGESPDRWMVLTDGATSPQVSVYNYHHRPGSQQRLEFRAKAVSGTPTLKVFVAFWDEVNSVFVRAADVWTDFVLTTGEKRCFLPYTIPAWASRTKIKFYVPGAGEACMLKDIEPGVPG